MLEEDLRSPCTEEIAVFRAFARTVDEGEERLRRARHGPDRPHDPAARRRRSLPPRGDPATRAACPRRSTNCCPGCATRLHARPDRHAARGHARPRGGELQGDLARAGIEPFAWVINQSLLASGTHDPLLAERGRYELPFIGRVAGELSPRCALIAWKAVPPIGEAGLAGFLSD